MYVRIALYCTIILSKIKLFSVFILINLVISNIFYIFVK